MQSKSDNLSGLKENIVMGRLIPAGTGLNSYRNWKLVFDTKEEEEEVALPGGVVEASQEQAQDQKSSSVSTE